MARLLDPKHSIGIILGAHDWSRAGLGVAPSFRRSAAHFHAWLLREPPKGLGLEPDFVVNLFDDPAPASAQLERIRDTVRSLIRERMSEGVPIRDLLIYYVGHGTCESGRQLNLLVRHSAEGIEAQSSIGAPDLAQVLRVAAPQQRRLVILDCCFSEAAAEAFGAMGVLDEAVATAAVRDLVPQVAPPDRGTVLLCSSPRRRFSIGRPDAARTLFSGAMLSVLEEGVTWRQTELLSFADLRNDIYDRMLRDNDIDDPPRPALHQPEQQDGDLIVLPAFPNAASSLTKETGPQDSAPVAAGRPSRRDATADLRPSEGLPTQRRRRRSSDPRQEPVTAPPAAAGANPTGGSLQQPDHQDGQPLDRTGPPHPEDVDDGIPPSMNEIGQLTLPTSAKAGRVQWRNVVIEAVKKLTKVPTEGDIPTSKLYNARQTLKIPPSENILALYDDTLFGSNKDGVA